MISGDEKQRIGALLMRHQVPTGPINKSPITYFINEDCINLVPLYNNRISQRFIEHFSFVQEYVNSKGELKYNAKNYDFPVMTRQELEILFNYIKTVTKDSQASLKAEYEEEPVIKNVIKFELLKNNLNKNYDQIELAL